MRQDDARRIVRARSEQMCERCGNQLATEWHHRKNRSQGGRWHPANGLHLCSACHRWITEHPAAAYSCGWQVRRNDDPAAIPVAYRGQRVRLADDGTVSPVEVPA